MYEIWGIKCSAVYPKQFVLTDDKKYPLGGTLFKVLSKYNSMHRKLYTLLNREAGCFGLNECRRHRAKRRAFEKQVVQYQIDYAEYFV